MKLVWLLAVGLFVVLVTVGDPAAADNWWWVSDEDAAERSSSSSNESKHSWQPPLNPLVPLKAGAQGIDRGLKRFDAGVKKLAADGRRFFANAGEKLAARDEPKRTPTTPHLSWIRPSEPRPREREESWFGSWFRREEPRPSDSVADFMSAKRLDP